MCRELLPCCSTFLKQLSMSLPLWSHAIHMLVGVRPNYCWSCDTLLFLSLWNVLTFPLLWLSSYKKKSIQLFHFSIFSCMVYLCLFGRLSCLCGLWMISLDFLHSVTGTWIDIFLKPVLLYLCFLCCAVY